MAKIADKYFEVDEWKIIEKGFNPKYGKVSESIFSLGNEYMGMRGYFEEEYSDDKLIGSYFNGVYERTKPNYNHYKGIADFTEYMVNAVNWLYTRIEIDGEELDLAKVHVENFTRELDLRTGLLTREFRWDTKSNKQIDIRFERFLLMKNVDIGAQKITITPVNFSGKINVSMGLDFSEIHRNSGKNMWNTSNEVLKGEDEIFLGIEGTTINTKQHVSSGCTISTKFEQCEKIIKEKMVLAKFIINLKEKHKHTITRIAKNMVPKDIDNVRKCEDRLNYILKHTRNVEQQYKKMFEETSSWWEKVWKNSDITIEGDKENQQGIRFCIFQMFQTYHGAVEGTNIGAKGLTGEAYNGNAFWDTETYCLPFFVFNNKEAARNLLYFRYKTLDEARKRAKVLDCNGAFYPIATISGKECCDLWQHASLQLQASTGVAYGIWFYEKIFHDDKFMQKYGMEMLIEISRMLVSRGDYSREGKYGYYAVMGPDEFQMMVNNNCYTNCMGKFTLEFTLEELKNLKENNSQIYDNLVKRLGLKERECEKWKEIAEDMFIPYHEDTLLFEQHDGFFKLPHLDIDEIPTKDFPLYNNWSYDRIYRNDMIKQPDVLMLMLLFNSKFTNEQLKTNYEYYEPCCIHESSLSPSVHSILATQLNKHEEAYEFFKFATRMDLDNYNRNTDQGIHTTSIAAAWMNIIYGFGGLRSDGEVLSLSPTLPKNWSKYSFRISYLDEIIEVVVDKETVSIKTLSGNMISLRVYDKEVNIAGEGYTYKLGDIHD